MPSAGMIPVTESYLEALGARLTRGRLFTAADSATSPPVAVVNEALAAAIWPGEDPDRQVRQAGLARDAPRPGGRSSA